MKALKVRKLESNLPNEDSCHNVSLPLTARTARDLKIIKFTGDMKENTASLLENMHCVCGLKRDYSQIVYAYGDKISKLREERNCLKDSLVSERLRGEQIHAVNKELIESVAKLETEVLEMRIIQEENFEMRGLERENETLQRENQVMCLKMQQLQKQKGLILKEYKELEGNFNELNLQMIEVENTMGAKAGLSEIRAHENSWKADTSDLLEDSIHDIFDGKAQHQLCQKENELLKAKLSRIQQTFGEYSCSLEQVREVLHIHYNNMPRFQTQEEKNLYEMASQMNVDLWKKKLEIEVKSICAKRAQLKSLQESLKKVPR